MSYRETVDDYIRRFGEIVRVEFAPLDDAGYTSMRRGAVIVGINVLDDRGVLMLLSPVIDVPAEHRLALYTRLLQLNMVTTNEAAFATDAEGKIVYLRALRALDQISFEQFLDLLDTVATTADEWAKKLRDELAADASGDDRQQ